MNEWNKGMWAVKNYGKLKKGFKAHGIGTWIAVIGYALMGVGLLMDLHGVDAVGKSFGDGFLIKSPAYEEMLNTFKNAADKYEENPEA